MRRFLYLFILFLLSTSCAQSTKEKTSTNTNEAWQAKKEPFVLLSPDGDTIPTGVPIPAAGKRVDPDSVAGPETFPLRAQPRAVPLPLNVHPAGTPKVVPVSRKLTVLTPGKDGIPLPETVPARGKRTLAGQPEPVPALAPRFKEAAKYDIRYLDVDQGMISSYVNSMLQDRQGNLWFGTLDGVSRYDGHTFTHYTTREGLVNNFVWSMMEDSRGHLWFGTEGGLSRYDGHCFTNYTTNEGLSENWVLSMLEDSRGYLWFGTYEGGLLRFEYPNSSNSEPSVTHFTTEQGLSDNIVLSILEDGKGYLWFGTRFGGVNRYNPGSGKFGTFTHFSTEEGLSDNVVISMLEDSRGDLWFTTHAGGVNRFDGRHFTHYTTDEGLSHNWVRSIQEDDQGHLWFGTYGGGVSRYDGQYFTHYTTEEGLSHNYIRSMLKDRLGVLWFGTRYGGVSRYNDKSFTHFTTEEDLSHNWIRSMLEDSQGYLWLGTNGGGVARYDGHTLTRFTTEEGLSSDAVWSILEDSRGHLWFGTNGGGVSRFDGYRFTHYTTKEGLSHNWVRSMLEDSRGHLWFGTEKGVSHFDGHHFTHYTTEEGLNNDFVYPMLEDSRGHLWFGTRYGGVSRFDGQNFKHYTTAEGLSDNLVWSILEDSRGHLWIGTQGGGVSRFDGQKFTHYTTEEGLSNNWVLSMLEDSRNNIWMATQKGITLVRSRSQASLVTDESGTEDFQFFDFGKLDGLNKLDFERSVVLDRHNRIWWGTSNGVTMLDLDRFELPTEPPQSVQLTHIEVQQQYVDYRRLADSSYKNSLTFGGLLDHSFDSVASFYNYPINMRLPHHLNHLTFHFSSIDWAAPHNIRYRYLLEGLDKGWSAPGAESKADYRNLPYGTFTFKVKAMGAAQIWTAPFEYTFTIRPPWWQTWWAYTLYGMLVAGLLYVLYRFLLNRQLQLAETERLRELDQVKTRLYTNITHEFRTPLTIILGMADKVAADPGKWLSQGTAMIRRNGRNLLRLVNQMLDLSKLESGRLELEIVQGDVIAYLRYVMESFHSLAATKNISMHFAAEGSSLIMDYDPDKLLSIVSNLLSNALKFTREGGAVYLQLAVLNRQAADKQLPAGNCLLLTVKDTGIGIPPEKLPHIFDRFYQADDSSTREGEGTGIGLALTRELVKLMGGRIEAESTVGRGTEFRIALPIRREAPLDTEMQKVRLAAEIEAYPTWLTSGQKKSSPVKTSDKESPVALVVEDNPDVVNYLVSCLQGAYHVKVAFDGKAGIEAAFEVVPDIIISDVMMPEADGYELCRRLKTDPRTSHIPVILLTARADMGSRLEGLEEGADAYLAKPFHPDELLVRVRKLLEGRENLQAHYLALAGGRAQESNQAPGSQETREHQFVAKLRRVVEDHLADPELSVEILCREIAMSHSQLHRKLKALTGYSTTQFVRYIRLTKARRLLEDSDLSISEIAYDTGFTDPGYFSRVFRQEFGVSPTAFRKNPR